MRSPLSCSVNDRDDKEAGEAERCFGEVIEVNPAKGDVCPVLGLINFPRLVFGGRGFCLSAGLGKFDSFGRSSSASEVDNSCDVRGVSIRGRCSVSKIGCFDADPVSVLLLLSLMGGPWLGCKSFCAAGPDSFPTSPVSPVRSILVNVSTSIVALFPLVAKCDGVIESSIPSDVPGSCPSGCAGGSARYDSFDPRWAPSNPSPITPGFPSVTRRPSPLSLYSPLSLPEASGLKGSPSDSSSDPELSPLEGGGGDPRCVPRWGNGDL